MPPITETETIQYAVHEEILSCATKLKWNKQNENDINRTTRNLSPYDEALLNQKEPFFMKPVRDWEKRMGFVTPIRWVGSIMIVTFHVVTVSWLFYCLFRLNFPKWQTVFFGLFMGQVAGFGVTGGAHRLWCHRSYKAKWPLKLILIICYSVAGQNTIYDWVRDHRVHHKFSETSADPHNANRGFFFSHVGWLMLKKHPDVMREGRKTDMRDIDSDPFVRFHTKYFSTFRFLFCWALPTLVPYYVWNETGELSILSQIFARYLLSLNFTWSVNSFAHLWGNKPYDTHIMPVENRGVSIVAMGEGWHNYHHTFPWDYKAAELGVGNNATAGLINLFAKIGWAYDLKEASPELVQAVIKNRGAHRDD